MARRAAAAGVGAALTLKNADAVLSMVTDKIDARVIAEAPQLRVISNLAVGVDNIDLEAATRAGIAVGHTPGVLTEATADLAFGLLMATARRIAEADRHVRAGKWRTWGPMTLLGRDVHSSTLGLIGFGAIGQAMARRAAGFGMRVLYLIHPSSKLHNGRVAGAVGVSSAAAAGRFRLRVDSCTADGKDAPHDWCARVRADEARRDSNQHGARSSHRSSGDGRGVEVRASRWRGPRRDRSGADCSRAIHCCELDNVVITPHIGSASIAARARMAAIAVQNILDVFIGRVPRFCANEQVRLRPLKDAT